MTFSLAEIARHVIPTAGGILKIIDHAGALKISPVGQNDRQNLITWPLSIKVINPKMAEVCE